MTPQAAFAVVMLAIIALWACHALYSAAMKRRRKPLPPPMPDERDWQQQFQRILGGLK